MSAYFVKSGEKIHGPFSESQIQRGLASGKLKNSHLVSDNKNGPWRNINEALETTASKNSDSENLFENLELPEDGGQARHFPAQTITPKTSESSRESIGTGKDNENLLLCPDCSKSISKRATSCPHCGCPLISGQQIASEALGLFAKKASELASKAQSKVANSERLAKAISKSDEMATKLGSQAKDFATNNVNRESLSKAATKSKKIAQDVGTKAKVIAESTKGKLDKEKIEKIGDETLERLRKPFLRRLIPLMVVLAIVTYVGINFSSSLKSAITPAITGLASSNASSDVTKPDDESAKQQESTEIIEEEKSEPSALKRYEDQAKALAEQMKIVAEKRLQGQPTEAEEEQIQEHIQQMQKARDQLSEAEEEQLKIRVDRENQKALERQRASAQKLSQLQSQMAAREEQRRKEEEPWIELDRKFESWKLSQTDVIFAGEVATARAVIKLRDAEILRKTVRSRALQKALYFCPPDAGAWARLVIQPQ